MSVGGGAGPAAHNIGLRTLAAGEVEVWYRLTDTLGETDVMSAVALLSSDERAQQSRFVFARDSRDYAAAHALLRESLSRYADIAPTAWRFRAGGKPSLAADHDSRSLSFNLSHTHGLVACAVAGGRDVGVDVEPTDRRVDDGVAERYFSKTENADLQRCASHERQRRFVELWTLKEAYVKAIGEGLAHPLNTIVFEIHDRDSIVFVPPAGVDARAWQFALFAPTERYRLAVAISCDSGSSARIDVRSSDGTDRLLPVRASLSSG
jgi:4'-phosphopantetheinyl transferase